ncbi:MAG: DUF2824 family protein [Verrucomicrobiota bacterium]
MNLVLIETRDAELVWDISQTAEVREHVTNDLWAQAADDVRAASVKLLVHNAGNHVLAVSVNGSCGGCFLFDQKQPGVYEVHTMLLPNCRGHFAIVAGRLAIKWMFALPGIIKLESFCPMNHREILFFALRCGFKRVETIVGGWIKNGATFDLVRVEKLQESPCL